MNILKPYCYFADSDHLRMYYIYPYNVTRRFTTRKFESWHLTNRFIADSALSKFIEIRMTAIKYNKAMHD